VIKGLILDVCGTVVEEEDDYIMASRCPGRPSVRYGRANGGCMLGGGVLIDGNRAARRWLGYDRRTGTPRRRPAGHRAMATPHTNTLLPFCSSDVGSKWEQHAALNGAQLR
jgi:hypothetical protein